jgi:hypothetical protein
MNSQPTGNEYGPVLRRRIGAAVLVALVLRLAFGLGYWVGKPMTQDEDEYLLLARSLARGDGFVYGDEAEARQRARPGRVPGYPLFIALVTPDLARAEMPREVPVGLKVAQSFVGAGAVWLIALIARRAAGNDAAVFAAWIASMYPPLVWMCAYALSETVYSVIALGTVAYLSRVTDVPRAGVPTRNVASAFAAGVLTGIATLTRAGTLLILPLACLYLALRRNLAGALAVGLGALLVVAPWALRNLGEQRVGIASQGAQTFWTGNNPAAIGEGDLAANVDLNRANEVLRRQHGYPSADAMEPVYYAEALRFIREQPLVWLWLTMKKFFYLWVPVGPSYMLHSALYRWASWLSYGFVLPFGVLGGIKLARGSRPPVALWLLAASAILTCLIFFPQERFRVPVIDPTLIVCASAWLASRMGRRTPARISAF